MSDRRDRRPVYFLTVLLMVDDARAPNAERTRTSNVVTLRHPFDYMANPPAIYDGCRILWWKELDASDENAAAFFLKDFVDDEAARYLRIDSLTVGGEGKDPPRVESSETRSTRDAFDGGRLTAIETALRHVWHNARTPHFDFDEWASVCRLLLGEPKPGQATTYDLEAILIAAREGKAG